jgi:hypothetical protein
MAAKKIGVRFLAGARDSSFLHNIQSDFGASYIMATGGCYLGLKRQKREVDHPLPSRIKV